jgi:hypothetical protein
LLLPHFSREKAIQSNQGESSPSTIQVIELMELS